MTAEWLAVLNVTALVVGVGTPVATLIYNIGKNKQWRIHVDEAFKRISDSEEKCANKREECEERLWEHVDKVESDLSYQKGVRNGGRT